MSSVSTPSLDEERAFTFAECVLALLCRSISNFKGALTMARHDQAVGCRTLVGSCWENLFLVDGLLQHGAAFVKAMRSHEAWGRISLGEASLKHAGVADNLLIAHGSAGQAFRWPHTAHRQTKLL